MMDDAQFAEFQRACSRIHELAAAMWIQRARGIAKDDSAWRAFLESAGLDEDQAARYEREFERAKADGEVLPYPPWPKGSDKQPASRRLEHAAHAFAEARDGMADPTGSRKRQAPPTQPAQPGPVARPAPIPEPPREQCVYFIQGVDGGPIKIGTSCDPDARLATLQIASPIELRIIGLTGGGATLERSLHKRLAAHRLHGEWFADVSEVIAAIAEVLQ